MIPTSDPSEPRPQRRPRAVRRPTSEGAMLAHQSEDLLVADEPPPGAAGSATARTPGVPITLLRPLSPVPTYLGIGLAAIGFVLLGVAWGGVAGESNVARQVPYLISGGLVGLGLIMLGMTTLNIASKRRDAALREQQIQLLAAALHELRAGGAGR